MKPDVVKRLERAPETVADSSFDMEHLVRRSYRHRALRWASSAIALMVVVVFAAWVLPALEVGKRVLFADNPGPADSESTRAADTSDWRHYEVTAHDGGVIDIYGPPELQRDGATLFAILVFDSEALEFTVGGPSYASFFKREVATRLQQPERMGGGTLSVGRSDNAASAALWEGQFYSVSTTSGSLGDNELESLFRQLRLRERDTGVVLHGEPRVGFDSFGWALHQPLGEVGALEVRPRPDRPSRRPEGNPEPAAGGALYTEQDGSFVLVSDTALTRFTPASNVDEARARAIMSELTVSWVRKDPLR